MATVLQKSQKVIFANHRACVRPWLSITLWINAHILQYTYDKNQCIVNVFTNALLV